MYYKVEFDIRNFEFWSGARDRIESATDDQIDQVEQRIKDYFDACGEIPTDAQINDIVWFECDDIFFPEEDDDTDDNE